VAVVGQTFGVQPVFADVDARTLNLTPTTVASCLTDGTRSDILAEQVGSLDPMAAMCDPSGIVVSEHAACAAGSAHRGRPAGAAARLAAFSQHPRKVVTAG
jgi:dTDP-4-amino-4,6-dideoxygalactose transaminase